MNTEEISRLASETWHMAEEDFRLFFSDYAEKINQVAKKYVSLKFKQFEVRPKRKSKINYQQNKYLYVEQEEAMKKIYEKEVEEFEFVSF
ncbi:hypothetical protein RclHR1_00460006 [Rhizophagus clarus]|nr:hypothetical protein RclHR1_00460006 [Rhizophagus clarus]